MRLVIQTRCPALGFLLLICVAILQWGCTQQSHGSPEGYDLRTPQKRQLAKVLNEVSGLTFNTDSNSLLVISDSKRKVYSINLTKQKLRDYAEKFWEQGDFEDLVKIGDTVFVLISDGTILAVGPNAKDSTATRAYPFWLEGSNDFESLYFDPARRGLVILCKSCEQEKGQGVRTAYRFDLEKRKFDSTSLYSISSDSVKAAVKKTDATFKPSAAAIHPVDGRLYILSSAGKLMVIADTKGRVLEAYNLNPDKNPQAEGLTFAPNGTMFISNEGKYGKATLHIYPYKGQKLATPSTN